MDNRTEYNSRNQNLRQFISKLALGSVGVISASGLATTIAKSSRTKINQKFDSPDITVQAPDGKILRTGLVGCGGRGTEGVDENPAVVGKTPAPTNRYS